MISKVYIKCADYVINPIITVDNDSYYYGDEYDSGTLIDINITSDNCLPYRKSVKVSNGNCIIKCNPILNNVVVISNVKQTLSGQKVLDGNSLVATTSINENLFSPLILRSNIAKKYSTNGVASNTSLLFRDKENSNLGYVKGYVYSSADSSWHSYGVQFFIENNNTTNGAEYLGIEKVSSNNTYKAAASSAIMQSISNWSFPNNIGSSVPYSLGASGTLYTAPKNGWFCLNKSGNQGQYFNIAYDKGNIEYGCVFNGQALSIMFPVSLNERFFIYYNLSGKTNIFNFIPAVGSV